MCTYNNAYAMHNDAGLTPAQSEAVVSTMGVVTKATLDRIASSDVSTKDMVRLKMMVW